VAETWYPSWDNAISGTGPISAQFRKTRSADVEKRNAVVGAFKVRWLLAFMTSEMCLT